MRALVTGATGFIGPRLLRLLDQPVVLSRNASRASASLAPLAVRAFDWNAMETLPPAEAFEGVEAVFHLAGEPVAGGRWTEARKQAIRDSRVIGTANLVRRLEELPQRPSVLVSASAVGYYGSRGEQELTEDSPPGNDFLAEVCVAWEREAQQAAELGIRVVRVRIGIVLGRGGGALQKMLTPFKFGLGGRLGNGQQWMPWIHVDDLARLFVHAAEHASLDGPVNGVAPGVARNAEFTKALARQLKRPAILPAPYFGMRLMFGEFADVLFASQRVVPKVAQQSGFEFRFPHLDLALHEILHGADGNSTANGAVQAATSASASRSHRAS
jgi:uncharacterized protein (TIGR01777 family)